MTASSGIRIGARRIGAGCPVYIVAELSANHLRDRLRAQQLVKAARAAGADAVKVQTYTADTMTLAIDSASFVIGEGNPWSGRTLHDIYDEAHMPWEWHAELKAAANDLAMDFFSSPFDASAVDFLETLGVPVFKIASFELVDLPLVRRVAATGKPMIMSTGMATIDEIDEAVATARKAGCREIALLKCTSGYPALAEEMNLRGIPALAEQFGLPVGLSDHTMESTTAIAAVALGACMVEKHLTLSRADGGPDGSFSLEPQEFRAMVDAVRATEASLGSERIGPSPAESKHIEYRRSLFVVEDVVAGAPFTARNVRAIRPGDGLHTRHLEQVLSSRATRNIARGTPLSWDLVERP